MSNKISVMSSEYNEDGISLLKRGIVASLITAILTIGIFTAISFSKCNDSNCSIHHNNSLVKMIK